jgi:hypothetical protein
MPKLFANPETPRLPGITTPWVRRFSTTPVAANESRNE